MTNKCLGIVEWLQDWFTTTEDLVDVVYPIGSIYMSVNNTSPQTLFGGTWDQLSGQYLLAWNADYGTTAGSNVAIVPPGIESKILGGNNYQSDYTRQTEIFRNNILRTFVTPQSQAGNEKSNQNVAEYINDSAITGFIVNVANDQKWVLKYCNELLNLQLELMGISETLDIYFSYSRDDVLRYIMELSSEGDEIYKNYLSNFEEEQPVGERILTDSGVEI